MQSVENRGLEEKAAERCGLSLQYLFDQIVHNVAMIPCKGLDKAAYILLIL